MSTINADALATFDKLLEPGQRGDMPGYVVGIAQDNRTVYRRATGLASIEFGVVNTPSTRMRIGSVTKQFTGLAIMLLVEDGKLDIDRPVREYLPDLNGPNGTPTLRQLLNHTSGVRDALESAGFFLTEGLFPQIPAGVTHRWSSQFTDTNFAPGEGWCYSNYGYMLLSLVIEKVSGLSLVDFFRQRVFDPLGMTDSEMFPNDMELTPNLATSHIRTADGRYRRGIYPCEELVGGGGIVSTVDDMLRWATQVRGPRRLGSEASWLEMRRGPRFNNGAEYSYGFGIKRQIHRGVEMLWHAGSTIGSTCVLLCFPAHALDVVVMSNRSDSDPSGIGIRMAEALLGDRLGPPRVNADAAAHAALIGRYYASESRRVFGIQEHAGKLMFALNAIPEGLLRDEDGALGSDSSAGLVKVRHEAGSTVPQIEVEISGQRDTYARLPEKPPAESELADAMVGHYRLADFGTPVQIILEQNALYIDLCSRYQPCRILLKPLSADVFAYTATVAKSPVQGIVTLLRHAGLVTGFFFNTQKSLNLRFSRIN